MRIFKQVAFLFSLFFLCLALFAAPLKAQSYLGPIGGEGGFQMIKRCPPDTWMTGVALRHDGNFFKRIRIRCTGYDADGTWVQDSHSWGIFTNNAGHSRADRTVSLECPRDHFIRSAAGRSDPFGLFLAPTQALTGLQIGCYGAGEAEPVARQVSLRNQQYRDSEFYDWRLCDGARIASELRIMQGAVIDSLDFGCTEVEPNMQDQTVRQDYPVPGVVVMSVAQRNNFAFYRSLPLADPLDAPDNCRVVGNHFETKPFQACYFIGFGGIGACDELRDGWIVKEVRMRGVSAWLTRPDHSRDPTLVFEVQNDTGQVRVSVFDTIILEGPAGPPNNWINAFNHCMDLGTY